MKTKKNLLILSGILLISSFIALSCSSPRITAVSCPDFSNKRISKTSTEHRKNEPNAFTPRNRADSGKQPLTQSGKNHRKTVHASKQYTLNDVSGVPGRTNIAPLDKIEYSEGLIASADKTYLPVRRNGSSINSWPAENSSAQPEGPINAQQYGCDTLFLKSGSSLIAKVEEIGQNEIRYRRCDNLNGPVIIMSKSDVISISYVNGTREAFPADNPLVVNNNYNVTPLNNAPVKTEGLAIAGFAASIVGLFVAGVPLGLLGVIFGAISLGKIKRQQDRLRGRGLAIAAIVIGLVSIIGALVVISTM